MNVKFNLDICGIRVSICAPIYIKEICNYLINHEINSDFNDIIYWNILEVDDCKVEFNFFDSNNKKIQKIVDQKNSLFFFFVLLEQTIAEKLMLKQAPLIFHGGSFACKNNAIMVIQGKGAGKTTLIAKMSSYKKFNYLADDVVACLDSLHILALPLPLRLRINDLKEFNLKGNFLGECIDFNGNTRYLFLPDSWSLEKSNLKTIIIPEYIHEKDNMFSFEKIKGIDKIKILIKNLKEVNDIYDLYQKLINLSSKCDIYHCKYSGNIEYTAIQMYNFLKSKEFID